MLELKAEVFDRFKVRPEDLHAHRCAETTLEHDDSRFDRLQFRCGRRAGNLCRLDDRFPYIVRRTDVIAPLAERSAAIIWDQFALFVSIERVSTLIESEVQSRAVLINDVLALVGDDGFDHRDRSRIKRCFGAPDLADHFVNLGNGSDRHVDLLERVERFANRSVQHRRRHVEERTLIKRGHELLAQAGEGVIRTRPGLRWFERRRITAKQPEYRRGPTEGCGIGEPAEQTNQYQDTGNDQVHHGVRCGAPHEAVCHIEHASPKSDE